MNIKILVKINLTIILEWLLIFSFHAYAQNFESLVDSTLNEIKNGQQGENADRAVTLQKVSNKTWPKNGIRGINTKLVAPVKGNAQNPGQYLSEETFRKFVGWNINTIRVSIDVDDKHATFPQRNENASIEPYKNHLKGLGIALDIAEKFNINIIVTAGNIAGRKIDVLYEKSAGSGFENSLLALWKYIAGEYGSHPNLLAYDLLNEPHGKELNSWQNIMLPALIKEIRKIDKNTYLVVEPGPYGLPKGFKKLRPVDDSKVVYSLHYYFPHNYTHQGVRGRPEGLIYPGRIKNFDTSPEVLWDKKQIQKSLQSVRDFQLKNNAIILIGEFSVIRWAPGAAKWLEDSISVFEELGWDWCYHSYGGWNGWNPTFEETAPENNDLDGGLITDRLNVLLQAWKRNQ